jgi:hypothetical protein
MKVYSIEEIRAYKGLPNTIIQSKFGEIDNALAQKYLDKIIIRTKVKEFKEKREYPIIKELLFIQLQIDTMELVIRDLILENSRLQTEIKYLKE